jgi:hypothetical protein
MGQKYTAIAIFPDSTLRSFPTDQDDPQQLADEISALCNGNYPQTVLTVASGPDDGDPPVLIKRNELARDFSSHVGSVDSVVETIKTWIDGLDDIDAITELFTKVTGAVNVRVIQRNGSDALIGWDLP